MLLFPAPGLAKAIFYGVGNDGYFTDVIGIETALSGSIRADAFFFIHIPIFPGVIFMTPLLNSNLS